MADSSPKEQLRIVAENIADRFIKYRIKEVSLDQLEAELADDVLAQLNRAYALGRRRGINHCRFLLTSLKTEDE